MTPKQHAAIERHGRQLLAIFPDADERDPVKLCKRLRRLEGEGHRFAERCCNHPIDDEVRERVIASILRRVRKLLGDHEGRVWLNGDPRGYALKINLRDCEWCGGAGDAAYDDAAKCEVCHGVGRERLATDWGGYGIIAPEIGPEGD